MAFTPIDQIPTGLRSQSQEVFDIAIAGFMAQFPTTIRQFNSAGEQVDKSAGDAIAAAVIANAQASAAQAAVNVSLWAAGNFNNGECRWSPSNGQTYRKIGAGPGFTDPAYDPAGWRAVVGALITTLGKSGAYKAVKTDQFSHFSYGNGDFLLELDSGAALGNGWTLFVSSHADSGAVSITATSGNLINGLPTYALGPKRWVILSCNGSNFSVVASGSKAATGYMLVREESTVVPTVDNQTAIAASLYSRVPNTTKQNSIAGASLNSVGEIALPPGRYLLYATALACRSNNTHLILWNNTAGAAIMDGPTAFSAASGTDSVVVPVEVRAEFTLGAAAVISIRQAAVANASLRFGPTSAGGAGGSRNYGVFCQIEIHKVG